MSCIIKVDVIYDNIIAGIKKSVNYSLFYDILTNLIVIDYDIFIDINSKIRYYYPLKQKYPAGQEYAIVSRRLR